MDLPRLTLLVALPLLSSVATMEKACAQSRPTDWTLGVTASVAPIPYLLGSVGLQFSRIVTTSSIVSFQFGVSASTSVAHQGMDCLDIIYLDGRSGCGDTRFIGQAADASALLAIGPPHGVASLIPYLLAGGGWFISRWGGGSPAYPNAPLGPSPSGPFFEGGFGWRFPLAGDRIRFELVTRKYSLSYTTNQGIGYTTRVSYGW